MEVYRGFVCHKDVGVQIRETNDKNEEEYFNQKEGLGLSYTLNKDVAIAFATRWTDFKVIIQLLTGYLETNTGGKVRLAPTERDKCLRSLGIFDLEKIPISQIIERIQNNPDNELSKIIVKMQKDYHGIRTKTFKDFDKNHTNYGVRSVLVP